MTSRMIRLGIQRIVVAAVFVAGCSGSSGVDKPDHVPKPAERGEAGDESGGETRGAEAGEGGLVFELEDAGGERSDGREVESAAAEPLEEEATRQLLSRLPPLEDESSRRKPFSFASRSRAPERTGDVEASVFPPKSELESPSESASAEETFEVVRRSPEGRVDVASRLNVTFSKPMIAVGESPNYDQYRVPVQIRPEVEGDWRWVGVRTLVFRPEAGRFPMATSYRATIPEDVESRDGERLGESVSWTFETPAVRIEEFYPPEGPQSRDPLIFMAFNQRVEREEFIEHVEFYGGGETFEPRLAARARVEQHPDVAGMLEETPDRQWLAFHLSRSLRPETTYAVGLEEATPSAEGPRRTKSGQYQTFETHGEFELEEAGCGPDRCRPGEPISLEFNHGLDPSSLDETTVQVEPDLGDRNIAVRGRSLVIYGESEAKTTLRVGVSGRLRDEFGERLGSRVVREVEMGPPEPRVVGAGSWATLDPEGPPEYGLRSVGFERLSIEAYRVKPSDWATYLKASDGEGGDVPGVKKFETTMAVDGEPEQWSRTTVDLREVLGGDHGHAVVVARGVDPTGPVPDRQSAGSRRVQTWVQSTDLAVDAFVDDRQVIAWVTSLSTGVPQSGVRVSLGGDETSAETGDDGVARIDLPEKLDEPWTSTGSHLRATQGGDTAFVPEFRRRGAMDSRWRSQPRPTRVRWYTFDDRHLYRPGESLHVKGWVREHDGSDLEIPERGRAIRYSARGPRGDEFESGRIETDAHGGFDLTFRVPENVNLGRAQVEFSMEVDGDTETKTHVFEVQDFRNPSFEVDVSTPPGPHLVGESIRVEAEASYYGGGSVGGADIAWNGTSGEADYAPPGWENFVFGVWRPWWRPPARGEGKSRQYEGTTDAAGDHEMVVRLRDVRPRRAKRLELRGAVTDVDRQTIAGSDTVLVHPASVYVGLRTDGRFVGSEEPISVETVAAAIDGSVESGRTVRIRAEALEWTRRDGEWVEKAQSKQTCEVESDTEPVECQFQPEDGGVWRLTARVRDDAGRVNETRMRIWVAGEDEAPVGRMVKQEQLQLVPQAPVWKPGETAEVLVRAPFEKGRGLATVQRDGVVDTIPFAFEGTTHRLEVPIEGAYMPNVHLRVDVVGAAPRLDSEGSPIPEAPNRPAHASQTVDLGVATDSRRLDVEVEPESPHVEPGGETTVDVRVQRPGGEPAGETQMAFAVVDEAVLAAADYELPEPVQSFFPRRGSGVRAGLFRESVMLAALDEFQSAPPVTMKHREMQPSPAPREAAGESAGQGEIEIRRDFRPNAYFEPSVETDEEGRASVTFELPDNVTRYRVMVVAARGADEFGKGTAQFTAQLPVRVEPSLPRFLHGGDRADLPVVVHNQTDEDRDIRLAGRSTNLSIGEPRGVRLEVPAGERVEHRFSSSTEEPGEARVQFGLGADGRTDAAQVEIPVRTPSTERAFAAHGTLDQGAAVRSVRVPEDVLESFGGLEVTTSSTALQELTDAFVYLVEYPHVFTEQRASRVLGIDALRDVLDAFDAEGLPDRSTLDETIRRDLETLAGLQTNSGGFPVWGRSGEADPFLSVHATHALAVGVHRGHDQFRDSLQRAVRYLREIDEHIPSSWSAHVRSSIRAYAVFVLEKAGAPQPGRVAKMAEGSIGDELSVEAAAWLVSTLSAMPSDGGAMGELRRQIGNRIVGESGSAHVTTKYDGGEHVVMHSGARADALVLQALLRSGSSSAMAQKFVEGLLGDRRKGRWANTQENVFALRALESYFEEAEREPPDFAADFWLGDGYLGRHEFRERSTLRRRVEVPMPVLEDRLGDDRVPLHIRRSGEAGRLYYRIQLEYASKSRDLEPVERGFVVERRYRAVGDEGEVRRKQDGSWEIEAGTNVRVEVEMILPSRRHHVVLEDPLVAGFEPLNPAIATTERVSGAEHSSGRPWWRRGPWFDHQNLKSERAEAFATNLDGGVYSYSYVVRARVPGTFVVPPPSAREMYHPETFGRGSTDFVHVVESSTD